MDQENPNQNPVDDGVTNDLLIVNELIYKIPPDLNIAQSRTQKLYRAGQNVYKYGLSGQGPMVEIMVQSGLEYIDPGNTTIEFDLEFSMKTTYNLNWSEVYRANTRGSTKSLTTGLQASNGPNIKADSKSSGGILGSDINHAQVSNACTRAGKWWMDGALSLVDTIELIHSSGQSLQKIVEVGPLANITHQFKYNYDRSSAPTSSHSQLNFANISHAVYSGLQAEMDGYQMIDPYVTRSTTNKPSIPNPTGLTGNLLMTLATGSQADLNYKDNQGASSMGYFLAPKPDGVQTASAPSAAAQYHTMDYIFEADASMTGGKIETRSMVQNMVNAILNPDNASKTNKVGSIAPYRAWAGDWLAGTVCTQRISTHVVIPLSRIPGLFEVDQMLPPQLMSGLKIQMKMAMPSQGLTYFYNTGINASRNNAGFQPGSASFIAEGFNPVNQGYTVVGTTYSGVPFAEGIIGTTQSELTGQSNDAFSATFVDTQDIVTRSLSSGLLKGGSLVANQPYTTVQNFPSDLGVLAGRPGEIRQEDFTHVFGEGFIRNCMLVADSYNLAPAIQRKLDAIAASGQMRLAYPNYTHIIPSVTEQTYVNSSQTQIPISIATENALWAFLGFRPNQASASYNANQMYTRFLPYIVNSYQARAGSYYYPADPVRVGQSGTWRDYLPFLRQQMLATGKLSKNYTGCLDLSQLLPDYFKLWVDSGKQCSKYMPTVYHLPCSTLCGLWVSLERSAVLQNSGMPLNQNRQLTFIVEGGLGVGPPGGEAVNPFSTQAGSHGDAIFNVYRCQDAFLNDQNLTHITTEAHLKVGPDIKQFPGYGGLDADTAQLVGTTYNTYSLLGYIPPITKIPGSDCIVSFPPSLYYNTGVQAVCYVASVAYLTILLNTIVKRE